MSHEFKVCKMYKDRAGPLTATCEDTVVSTLTRRCTDAKKVTEWEKKSVVERLKGQEALNSRPHIFSHSNDTHTHTYAQIGLEECVASAKNRAPPLPPLLPLPPPRSVPAIHSYFLEWDAQGQSAALKPPQQH